MVPTQTTLELGGSTELRRALAPRLGALLASLASRKAAWELLRGAGLTALSLKGFYALVRERGMDGLVDAVLLPERLAEVQRLVDNPPAAPPPRVAVSTLANQFYCEMQVDLGARHEVRVVSREMLAGTAGHAAFEAEAEELTEEEIARRMEAGEALGLVELGLTAERDGVRLVGRADRVQLLGERARLVLEFKFSGRRELYPSHVVQVQAYGELLAARGLDTQGLVHAVAVLSRGAPRPEGLADVLARRALEIADAAPWGAPATNAHATLPGTHAPDPLATLPVRRLDGDGYALHVFPHDPAAAERNLGWALAYWRGARPPEPTASAAKCRACPFNHAALCAAAHAPPDGRYASRVVEGRHGKVYLLAPAG